MIRKLIYLAITVVATLFFMGCSSTRYVPQGKYLLTKNKIEIAQDKKAKFKPNTENLSQYIIQRPNSRFLGMNVRLAFYNICDTAKHGKWHRFWINKVGQAPVVLDSALTARSAEQIKLVLRSQGFLSAQVSDSIVVTNKRKSDKRGNNKVMVRYIVRQNAPYIISSMTYNIEDEFLRAVLMPDTSQTLIRPGNIFNREVLDDERSRISAKLLDMGFWGFGNNFISYTADSSNRDNRVALTMNIKRKMIFDSTGANSLVNHPIYRIGRIVVNSEYDPTLSMAQNSAANYDTLLYNGVEILYQKKVYIRPEILINALRLSPNEIYDLSTVKRTYSNLRTLGYTPNILFSPISDTTGAVYVTLASGDAVGDGTAVTTEQRLACAVQCTPLIRQSINSELEISTTSDFYSAALKLGYQNRNIFGGAEVFNVSFRGAYEFMKNSARKNSYEFGVSTSLEVPRFWLPISNDARSKFLQASTRVSLSYSIQNRPAYNRTLVSATYGYGWTFRNGGRFTINPADVNVVEVPWVDPDFLNTIDNPYLRNSYQSQLIAGLSLQYVYSTNANMSQSGVTLRINGDINGNLFRGIAPIFGGMQHKNGESFYELFGMRFAQYARLIGEISGRQNVGRISQFAWRAVVGGAYAYANSNTVPFERLFFVGGSNSMRGWQPRTLGPGGQLIEELPKFPNQLGNIRVEANLEYRISVIGDFGMAFFVDAGNVWMNAKGEKDRDARFRFDSFYKQIALDAGIGVRYNLDFVILRLDWGWKLHNPNKPVGDRWFSQMRIGDTALHFAIGLPF